jgi:hypothetical protein
MSKITINEVEYETDNFTDEQKGILGEIEFSQSEVRRLDYLTKVMDNRFKSLVSSLTESINKEEGEKE